MLYRALPIIRHTREDDIRYNFVWQKREKQAMQGELPSQYTGAFTAELFSVANVGFPLLSTNVPRIRRGNPHRGAYIS